jgi:general secretion pathway protein N
MKRTALLIVLAVLVFLAVVIARLPAGWALPDPKSGVSCADAQGTVWDGTCTGLVFQQQALGDLAWEVHPTRLLLGKLNADVTLIRPTGSVRGNVEVGFDRRVVGRNIRADLPIDRDMVAALPPNLQGLRGTLHAELALVRFDGQAFRAIQGTLEARDLTDGTGNGAQSWGSYSLIFPPPTSGDPLGQLHDLGGGPLAVEGTLRLTREPGFDIEGLVAARPTASAELAQDLQFLGSPDAQGRRPFSLAGTF